MIKLAANKALGSHIILRKILGVCMALLVALPLAALLACGQSAAVKDASPRFASAEIAAAGDGTEAGQRVELRLRFSEPVAVSAPDAALGDFEIGLNGKELDKSAIAVALAADSADANVLLITLTPAKGADGPSSAHYFALYDGDMRIAARQSSGALPHVLSAADSSACAELAVPVAAQVPSGLRILIKDEVMGSAAENAMASCSIRVMEVPSVRVMAFIVMSPGGDDIKLHNHEFYNYTDANRDEFASMLADEIAELLGSGYQVEASSDTITIAHNELVDGEVLAPRVIEGVAGSE